MTLTLDLSPAEEQRIYDSASREGVSLEEYARRRLLPSPTDPKVSGKRFNVMQFSGIVPQPLAEIEAHIADVEKSRNEWDERDWRSMRLSEPPLS
jgi:hypothetical protein